MFGISWNEYILIAIVALIVIGPKELPGVLRAIGQWTAKVRRMAAEFQGQFHEAMREAEMSDLKKEVDDLSAQARGLTSEFSDPANLWEYRPEKKAEPAPEAAAFNGETSGEAARLADAAPEPASSVPDSSSAGESAGEEGVPAPVIEHAAPAMAAAGAAPEPAVSEPAAPEPEVSSVKG